MTSAPSTQIGIKFPGDAADISAMGKNLPPKTPGKNNVVSLLDRLHKRVPSTKGLARWRSIPEREIWLYSDGAAHRAVARGMREAAERRFAPIPPNLELDRRFADQLLSG